MNLLEKIQFFKMFCVGIFYSQINQIFFYKFAYIFFTFCYLCIYSEHDTLHTFHSICRLDVNVLYVFIDIKCF